MYGKRNILIFKHKKCIFLYKKMKIINDSGYFQKLRISCHDTAQVIFIWRGPYFLSSLLQEMAWRHKISWINADSSWMRTQWKYQPNTLQYLHIFIGINSTYNTHVFKIENCYMCFSVYPITMVPTDSPYIYILSLILQG